MSRSAPPSGLAASIGAVFSLVLASALPAQVTRDSTMRDSTARTIETVVVTAARNPATVGGAAAVVVAPAELNVAPAPSLQEVLRHIPFVLVRQNSRGETEISMRGSESRQVAIMLDGLPLTIGWDHRTDPSLIPVTGVQSVKMVRGLSSLLHGPNSLGGIVELGLGRSDLGAAPERELSVGTGIDGYGAMVASLIGGRRIRSSGGGFLSVRAGGGYHDSDGISRAGDVTDVVPGEDLRTNTHYRQYDGFATARWTAPRGAYIGTTVTGYSTERGVAPELHVSEPRFWKYPNQSRLLGILSAGTGPLTTPFGLGSIDASAGYNRGTVEITAFTDPTYTAIDGREWGDERLYSSHVRLSHSMPFNGQIGAAFTGARVWYGETLDTDPTNEYEQNLWSSGLEAEFPIASRFLISAGAVNDASSTPQSGGRTPLGRTSSWGWRAGASMLAFDERARFHASVSERSRFPALRELYSGSLNRFAPNPDLEPETLLGTELGLTFTPTPGDAGAVSFQIVGFHHNLDGAVVRTTLPDNRFFRVNRDEIKTTGAELLGSWRPTERGMWFAADLLIQDVQVRDQTIPDGDRRPEHQPELRGGIEIGLPLFFQTEGMAAIRHTGTQYCLNPDTDAYDKLDAETVGNVAVHRTWQLGSGQGLLSSLRTLLAIDNVTDSAVYDQCGLPQPGRTLRLGVQLR